MVTKHNVKTVYLSDELAEKVRGKKKINGKGYSEIFREAVELNLWMEFLRSKPEPEEKKFMDKMLEDAEEYYQKEIAKEKGDENKAHRSMP